MKKIKINVLSIIALFAVIGFFLVACDNSGGNDDSGEIDGWDNEIPSVLTGTWNYNGQSLFTIDANGTGSILGQGGYSVRTRNIQQWEGEVRFAQGKTETGQFIFSLNGDGDMWIQSGTGPFASWANVGTNPTNWVIRNGGVFTLTDIPSRYNGKYAMLCVEPIYIFGFASQESSTFSLMQISDGRVSIPLWNGSVRWTDSVYKGNGTFVTTEDFSSRFFVKLVSNKVIPIEGAWNEPGTAVFFKSVTFSRGSATKSYNENDLIIE